MCGFRLADKGQNKLASVDRNLLFMLVLSIAAGCGSKQGYDEGTGLEDAVLGGGGGTRTETNPTVVTTGSTTYTKPAPVYNIVNVTQIIEASSGLPGWTAAMLPFTGTPSAIGQTVQDAQTPFHYRFDFPQNNYQFVEAHLVIDTARDSSDTEGIFVNGVFTGRPPLANVNSSSTEITDKLYFGNGVNTPNTHFIDFSLAHYKVATRNTFDLLLSDLLKGSGKTSLDILKGNELNVVTGDDSRVYQAYLVLRGRTISDSSLSCSQSPTYTFTNRYIHNDGNTVGAAAFSAPIGTPFQSWGSAIGTYKAVEFNFDAPLPKVDIPNVSVTTANIIMAVKRNSSGKAAIVVNGIGIAEPGFDRTTATAAVESWNEAAIPAFQSFLATIPTSGVSTAVTLNLVSLFGAAQVRDLLSQGKLNVSLAGSQIISGSGATSARGFSAPINGPELDLQGTYSTEVCVVPDNPDSALTQEGIRAVTAETETVAGSSQVLNDGAGPVISSLQATEIGSTKATILWLTDEPSTAVVSYGVGSPNVSTVKNDTLTTFHQIELTGLSPYKYYSFKVTSTDKFGNASNSNVLVFTTLR
jgi:hypothetical protein